MQMRLIAGLTALMISTTLACAQSKESLRARYGEPIRETFVTSEGLAVTVQYDSHDQACILRIEPRGNLNMPGAFAMTNEQLDKVMKELMPGGKGKPYLSGITNAAEGLMGFGGNFEEYENFSLSRTVITDNVRGGQFQFATVFFRRPECKQPRPASLEPRLR